MAEDPQAPRVLGAPRPGLFWPVKSDPAGVVGPTPKVARGPRWRTSSRGRFVPASVARTTEQRIVEAAAVLPEHGGVTGWAALHWQRARWFDGLGVQGSERPVWLVTAGDDIRAQQGIAISAERLDPRDLITIDGVRLTTAVRSTWFEMRYAETLRDAVRTLCMAAYDDLVSIKELDAYVYEHPGWTGTPQARAASSFADESCWSPMEVDMLIVWVVDADLPRPLCNRPIFDRRGNFIATPDLLDVEAGVVGEYEGPLHLERTQRSRDVRREELYRRHGLEYFTMLNDDRRNPSSMAERMHSTRARAAFTAESTRSWTVEPPSWWIPTHTVELRRALEPIHRERLLGYRAA